MPNVAMPMEEEAYEIQQKPTQPPMSAPGVPPAAALNKAIEILKLSEIDSKKTRQIVTSNDQECVSPESNPIQALPAVTKPSYRAMPNVATPASSQKSEQKVGLETQVECEEPAGLEPMDAEPSSCLPNLTMEGQLPAIRISEAVAAPEPPQNPRRSSTYRDSGDWLEQLAKMPRDRVMSSPQITSLLNKPRTMSSPQLDLNPALSSSRLLSQSPEKGQEKHCFDSLWRCRKVDTQSKSLELNGK
jgi:hypothetical protein